MNGAHSQSTVWTMMVSKSQNAMFMILIFGGLL